MSGAEDRYATLKGKLAKNQVGYLTFFNTSVATGSKRMSDYNRTINLQNKVNFMS
jgi:hypothetical protein